MEHGNQEKIPPERLLVGLVVKPATCEERPKAATQKRDLQQIGFGNSAQVFSGGLFVMPEHGNGQKIDQTISDENGSDFRKQTGHLCRAIRLVTSKSIVP